MSSAPQPPSPSTAFLHLPSPSGAWFALLSYVHFKTRSPEQLRRKAILNWRGLGHGLHLETVKKLDPVKRPFEGSHYHRVIMAILQNHTVAIPPTYDPALDTISLAPLSTHLQTAAAAMAQPAAESVSTSAVPPAPTMANQSTAHQCSTPARLVLRQPPKCPGFGHRLATLLIGLDVASRARTPTTLVIADNFWLAKRTISARSASANSSTAKALLGDTRRLSAKFDDTHGCAYAWAGELLPFPLASTVATCGRAKRGNVDDFLPTSGRRAAPCAVCTSVQAGGANCGRGYCMEAYEGGIDRAIPILHALHGSRLRASFAYASLTSLGRGPVRAVWHVRTGWVAKSHSYALNAKVAAQIKSEIDARFRVRGVVHTCLTQNAAQLRAQHPWAQALGMSVMSASDLDEEAGVRLMANAHVLVSAGSSFPYAAAAVAPLGAQLHVFLPPKELGLAAAMMPMAELRATGAFRGYFRAWNTVPFELMSGRPAEEYVHKLDEMAAALDAGRCAPAGVSLASHEPWMQTAQLAPARWLRPKRMT